MRIRTLSFLVGTLSLGLAAGPTAGQNAEQQHAAGQQAPGIMSMHGAAMQRAMQRMQQGMDMPSSGNQDVDFARMMIPHHQGAIDMAKAELADGKDPQLRQMAEEVIAAQEREIATLQAWLKQHQ